MLVDQLTSDLHAAMKSGDSQTRDVLRMAITAMKNESVSTGKPLDDAAAEAVLVRMKKQLDQAAAEYEKAGHADRAAAETAEAGVVARYLPEPLDDAALKKIVTDAMTETGTTSAADMGKVMQVVRSHVGNRADGGRIAALVKQALNK